VVERVHGRSAAKGAAPLGVPDVDRIVAEGQLQEALERGVQLASLCPLAGMAKMM
jgi:hypothetical protein